MGILALLAIVGIHLWDQLPDLSLQPAPMGLEHGHPFVPGFRHQPAGIWSEKQILIKSFGIPLGGRKDIIRWAGAGEKPAAEIEIYRPGGELGQNEP